MSAQISILLQQIDIAPSYNEKQYRQTYKHSNNFNRKGEIRKLIIFILIIIRVVSHNVQINNFYIPTLSTDWYVLVYLSFQENNNRLESTWENTLISKKESSDQSF